MRDKVAALCSFGVLFLASVVVGCTTTTKVAPAGQDTYMITAENDRCSSCKSPHTRATEQATEYCLERNNTMVVKDMKNETFDHGYGKRFTLTFSCLAPPSSTPPLQH